MCIIHQVDLKANSWGRWASCPRRGIALELGSAGPVSQELCESGLASLVLVFFILKRGGEYLPPRAVGRTG